MTVDLHPHLITDWISHSYAQYASTGAEQRWPAHLHSFHQFDATLAGGSELHFDGGRRIVARRGTGILIPPMVRHEHRTNTGFQVAMFKFRLAPGLWAPLGAQPVEVELSAGTLAALDEAAHAWQATAPWHREQSEAALRLCLVAALRQTTTHDRSSPALGMEPQLPGGLSAAADPALYRQLLPLLEAVEQDPFGDWTVARLAAACHLTADHFTKRFQAALEQGPQQYLRNAKMRAAVAALVAEPRQSIKAVAEAAGYATVHSFSRAFRDVTGVSPARFRKERGEL